MRAYRKILMLPALVWLLTQLAMVGIAGAIVGPSGPGSVGASNGISDDGSYTLVICTPTGWKTVTVNADGTTETAPPETSYQACEYCQTPDGAPVLTPVAPACLAPSADRATSWALALSTAAPLAHRPTGFRSRAPPA